MTKLTEIILKEFDYNYVNREINWNAIRKFLEKSLSKLEKEKVGTCEWKKDEHGYWTAKCCKGSVAITKTKFCLFCGKKIKEVK